MEGKNKEMREERKEGRKEGRKKDERRRMIKGRQIKEGR
jgi:hypothetical protein